ncbi:MAG TPA: class I SAM-dependent methyltransferase [Thermoanaerobaculia bacterium]|jgi:23S rRNA (cytosine1962-C5)-methyltransferase|nr:class I SAM-dependent methyltransferase [Thermoanaerobaculia bacterium]
MLPVPECRLLVAAAWSDYALLDSGSGAKLERYGAFRVIRPEPQAMWRRTLLEREWLAADAIFEAGSAEDSGHWRCPKPLPESWPISYPGRVGSITLAARLTPFRHLGLFPEQASHWDWAAEKIATARATGRTARVLNLFAYTGAASIAAALAGAEVTHVDASKKAIAWAKENQTLSGLGERSIRWIAEDAVAFLRREVRRFKSYDGIFLDPPKFGRGDQGQVWKLFDDLPEVLALCRQLLAPEALFLVLTTYAIRASFASLHYLLEETLEDLGGTIESGEICLAEEATGRILPTALYGRWGAG